jgi:hypothetical protein
MSPEIDIDYLKSIHTGRLQIRPYWIELLDTLVILMLSASMIAYPILIYGSLNWKSPNDRFVGNIILPVSILAGMIIFYKKLREKSLVKIDTTMGKRGNKRQVLKYMRSSQFDIVLEDEDMVVGFIEGDVFSRARQLTVLLDDGVVYACVISYNPKARMPSFFTARGVIKDLRMFLSQEEIREAAPAKG